MLAPLVIFYIFSAVTVGSGAMVVFSKNPVHSVLFLIVSFFSSAGLFVLQGAEFLAMILVIVYVGAIAVLFLFVVMMLDVGRALARPTVVKYFPLALVVGGVLLSELLLLLFWTGTPSVAPAAHPFPPGVSNTRALGEVLYTHYVLMFQVSGLILFVAMVGAITLTLRRRVGTKKQNINRQITRTPEQDVTLVKVDVGRGV